MIVSKASARASLTAVMATVLALSLSHRALSAERAAKTFDSGSLHVERYGRKGMPVILIPGLACGSWVWADTVHVLSRKYVVYAVTLAGIVGRPAAEGDTLSRARESLHELTASRRLNRPILVGHSLGGTLALDYAATYPDSVGGVVAVDGLPVFPGTEAVPPEQRGALAARVRTQLAVSSAHEFAAQQLSYMQTIGISSLAKAQELAERTSGSDPAAVARYAAEDMELDLRPKLTLITVPVLTCPAIFGPVDS